MRYHTPGSDALALSIRYNAEKGYHEAYAAGTDRKLGLVQIDGLATHTIEGADPADLLYCEATVNGTVGTPPDDGPVYPRLAFPADEAHAPARSAGYDLPLVDLATGLPIWGVMDVEVRANTAEVYAIRFTFLAQANEPGPEPLLRALDVSPYRQDGGALRFDHRDGALLLNVPKIAETLNGVGGGAR